MTTNGITPSEEDIHALRAFNRFYTRQAGVLGPYLSSDLSLTDVRVLYELAHPADGAPTATEIARTLGHDNGYLSRILKRFEARGWLLRTPHPRDGRQSLLSLTQAGLDAFAPLEGRSHAQAGDMLAALGPSERDELMGALSTVRRLLDDSVVKEEVKELETKDEVTFRGLQPGDIGWVAMIHGAQYFAEYGWGRDFEILAAQVVIDFARDKDPRMRSWIAERGGERVGCVFMMRGRDDETAKLRLLCLTPGARGAGLGARLVDEVLAHARAMGFKRLELWTHSCLTAARDIYGRRGFVLTESNPYVAEGGIELVGENWEVEL
ncbi:hypothetical protein CcaverHIS002_0408010 [Cutaneotrichosporon cavernicola]|uniref:MarR family transcriptional regulator n=1 Tax=Cutaneotrichosporon cavernicola TaxID=279322 RepID=A0AA48QW23_9TREE|nr:uncharacterized protein CcaverHIS019_0407990 [Cutaneotrichosporon cavernicola]BEI84197.1 hypothetical protein CcaverHIS002_0408010 [Cutaneotrichosporon cavernicola]BEI91979.1 hypothetical protein CcaverHIS019_0407990 [Cutaneotrichosporon cavernicola]BEI99750.1 hypothetical protein CcaverHIS631_0407930 [Cutaneotrichosporon cavernicola]BEJ07526.1 hypothetical protein CcaverHIS641_0407950 [Cutaneotrichosporon cavernicola]